MDEHVRGRGLFKARLLFICLSALGTGRAWLGGTSCPCTEGKTLWEGRPREAGVMTGPAPWCPTPQDPVPWCPAKRASLP